MEHATWHESIDALSLSLANPNTQIHDSVHREIFLSSAWDDASIVLPHDAAAFICTSRQTADYNRLAQESNNAEFGKFLSLKNGHITWEDGTLAVRATKNILNGSEILATRGYTFWANCGFPSRRNIEAT